MINDILNRVLVGIAFCGIITFLALTIMKFSHFEATVDEIWLHMLASLCLGVYFGISSYIYENSNWSPLKKTSIHFGLSLIIYFSLALPVGWIPFETVKIFLGIIAFTMIYIVFYFGYSIYYKIQAKKMNQYINKGKDNSVLKK